MVPEIDVKALASELAGSEKPVLLDVREPHERIIATLPGAVAIPLREIPVRAGELDPAAHIVVYCHHGGRSAQATRWLRENGFENAINLAGGIDAWSLQVDPVVARY